MSPVSEGRVLEELERIVSDDPDYIYTAPTILGGLRTVCVYVDPIKQEASCLVGRAFHAAGVPLSELAAYDRDDGVSADTLAVDYGLSNEAAVFLLVVQSAQDMGSTWAEALSRGKSEVAVR